MREARTILAEQQGVEWSTARIVPGGGGAGSGSIRLVDGSDCRRAVAALRRGHVPSDGASRSRGC